MDKKTEITLLEIDFEDDVTCDMLNGSERCGMPAVDRIYSTCACGNESRFFACGRHLESLDGGSAICGACGGPRGITILC